MMRLAILYSVRAQQIWP